MSRLRPTPIPAAYPRGAPPSPPPSPPLRPALSRADSHGSSHSGSSHSSHSSHEERQREQFLGETNGPPSAVRPVACAVGILLGLFACQAIALWLFTQGFLLSRVTLDGTASCGRAAVETWTLPPVQNLWQGGEADVHKWENALEQHAECTLPPTHSRALLFIIDALRYDFIAPMPASSLLSANTSWAPSPFHHDVLRLPSSLHASSAAAGHISFLSHFHADAPTTTLQRLKGLTTGTLPTFIDAGSNFAGSAIDEDSWLRQVRLAQLRTRGGGAEANDTAAAARAGLGLMGDETWQSVFPTMFDADWSWPYDSFNVEDLDTVDRGVEARLLPFLRAGPDSPPGAARWKVLVAHTLGVDHVGHRFGASHAKMRGKLEEMQKLLKDVVQALPEDAVLLLMGDHGMDERGDHGGDGELEVGAGLWIYSKASASSGDVRARSAHDDDVAALLAAAPSGADALPPYTAFSPLPSPPFSARGHRSVTQIDVVPTLSLLLGVPIPFNSLGTIIPELFAPSRASPDRLLRALRINARQVRHYVRSYAAQSNDLRPFEAELNLAWSAALRADAAYAQPHSPLSAAETLAARRAAAAAYQRYTRTALARARSVWAQFELHRMAAGLLLLALSVASVLQLRSGALKGLVLGWETREERIQPATPGRRGARLRIRQRRFARRTEGVEQLAAHVGAKSARAAAAGAVVGASIGLVKHLLPTAALTSLLGGLSVLDLALFGASFGAQLGLLLSQARSWTLPSRPSALDALALLLPLLHVCGLGSVAFVDWEDLGVSILLSMALCARAAHAYLFAPTRALRNRLVLLALGCALVMRLAALSRVCREEQAPHCRSTFYAGGAAGGGASVNSVWAMGAAYLCALTLPSALGYALRRSKSNAGVAPVFLNWVLRPTLLLGAGYWILDWAATEEWGGSKGNTQAFLEWLKLAVARADLVAVCVVGLAFWAFSPLCIELKQETLPVAPSPATAAAPSADAATTTAAAPPQQPQTRMIVLGFANSLGSLYLLLVALVAALLFLLAQPMGQLVLAAGLLSMLALAELGDSERDAELLRSRFLEAARSKKASTTQQQQPAGAASPAAGSFAAAAAEAASAPTGSAGVPPPLVAPRLLETTTLALLGCVLFFATGHQATFASIQWRVAFVGLRRVSYPLSPLLVALNAFGPSALLPGLAMPLLALWNLSPRPRGDPNAAKPTRMPTLSHLLATALGLLLYHSLLACGAAFFAAWFRRHLMLFKLWTPRYMLAAVELSVLHAACIAAIVAAGIVASKVSLTFGSAFE